MPSRVRPGAETSPMSSPRNSIVPEVAGMSPAMTLKRVVFPAPLGPRMARRSPGATSRSTSRTAWRPPNRRPTPRKRRVGSACSAAGASVKRLLDHCARDQAVPHDLDLALPRRDGLLARRDTATVRRVGRLDQTAERLIDGGNVGDRLRTNRAIRVLDEL